MGWFTCDLGGKVGMDHIDHMEGRGDMSGIGDLGGVGDLGCKGVKSGKDMGGMGIIGGIRLS